MSELPENVKKYLQKYSLSGWKLEGKSNNNFENVIVVPAICEYDNILNLLYSLLNNDKKYFSKTAIVFVVNNFSDSTPEVKTDNYKTLNFLRSIISEAFSKAELAEKIQKSELSICLIDASTSGLELPIKDGGVGFARKIGLDAALILFNYDSKSKKILISLDADCTIDKNYLTAIVENFNTKNLDAGYIKFQHDIEGNSLQSSAIICYEIFLHYYVLGLKYAGSPFAFHTVGSTIICDYESYIKVEGMNKQKAAEDFYFLEKLAKNYKIKKITTTAVYPSSRNSWRVPFGTGQRVIRFMNQKQNEYLLYDPASFNILKKWLKVFNSNEFNNSTNILNSARQIHIELANFLEQQNFSRDWERIVQNSKNQIQLDKQKQKWFDGFRTLKLIHYLRDKSFPPIKMFTALDELFNRLKIEKDFSWHENVTPDLEFQKKYLKLLRELTFMV